MIASQENLFSFFLLTQIFFLIRREWVENNLDIAHTCLKKNFLTLLCRIVNKTENVNLKLNTNFLKNDKKMSKNLKKSCNCHMTLIMYTQCILEHSYLMTLIMDVRALVQYVIIKAFLECSAMNYIYHVIREINNK